MAWILFFVAQNCWPTILFSPFLLHEYWKKVPWLFGVYVEDEIYPVMLGLFHKPWNKDDYQTTSIMFVVCRASHVFWRSTPPKLLWSSWPTKMNEFICSFFCIIWWCFPRNVCLHIDICYMSWNILYKYSMSQVNLFSRLYPFFLECALPCPCPTLLGTNILPF